ncbi:MAG: glycosyltransferase [Firmicutes bacterium]|nr:glycosyltransferase [Bacillota bacterium]
MNIVFFTDTFVPKVDGIVTSIVNTSEELLRRGHKVKIIAPRIRQNQEEIIKEAYPHLDVHLLSGVKAMFYPDYRITYPSTHKIVKILRDHNADIIHFHTPFTIGFEAILASAFMKLPLVSTFHTYFIEPEYLKIVHLHRMPGINRFGWAYSNFFHNSCDATISPSQFTADELCRKDILCPVRVISNGIALQEARNLSESEKKAIREKYGLKEKVMLFIGRVSVEKCIDVVMKAAKRVFEKRDDTSLLIVGSGPALDDLKELARTMGIEKNTVFAGSIAHNDLISSGIFEVSSFFVTASTSENQPMTIIEASMFGLPLIGVDAKGVPEMITDNGFVAHSGDDEEIAGYMEKLLSDEQLRKKMSENAKIRGGEYDIRKTTDQMEELYNLVISKVKRQGKRRKVSFKTLRRLVMG